jgi:hypothetical protein
MKASSTLDKSLWQLNNAIYEISVKKIERMMIEKPIPLALFIIIKLL